MNNNNSIGTLVEIYERIKDIDYWPKCFFNGTQWRYYDLAMEHVQFGTIGVIIDDFEDNSKVVLLNNKLYCVLTDFLRPL